MNQSNEERLQHLLCAYVLNEATDAERHEVEAALADSEELRAEKVRFESTIALVAGAYEGEEKLSEASVAELNLAASNRGGRVLQGPWYRKASVRVAATLVFVVGAFGMVKLLDKESATKRDDLVAKAELVSSREASEPPVGVGSQSDDARDSRKRLQNEDKDAFDLSSFGVPLYDDGAAEFELEDAQGAADQAPPEEEAELDALDLDVNFVRETPSVGAPSGPHGGTYRGAGDTSPPGGGGGAKAGSSSTGKLVNRAFESKSKKVKGSAGASGASSPGASGSPTVDWETHPAPPALIFPPPSVMPFDEEDREQLQSMGYAGEEDPTLGLRFELDPLGSDDFFLGHGKQADGDDEDLKEYTYAPLHRNFRSRRTPLTADEITSVTAEKCDIILRSCRRRPNESPRDMFFRYYGDNPFVVADEDKLSTFAADVDTSSYVLVRNYLKNRHLPTKAQVRTEEFVNYFRPDVEAPTKGVFRIESELAPSRFSAQPGRWMLRVAVRGREVSREERKPLNLTFVVDTSGSMKEQNRMELVKHALRLLVTQLDARDSISIVGFSTKATVILPMTSAANRGEIESAIYQLQPDGGTNPEAGLIAGYAIAAEAISLNSHSRVVLLSDGVGNIGETDQNRLTDRVKAQRELGIYLNTIGVGMNNHNDEFLEQLANKGDGLSNYIDDELEARRALVENFTGAFEPIARDVKIQVEFDPAQVYRYRQLGYENRAVADADFRNDKVDAGEIGAGHQVVCLYELELDPSYNGDSPAPLATVRLRYKEPTGAGRHPLEDSATEITHVVNGGRATSFEGASAGFRRSVIAAQFAEILRRSEHARGDSITDVIAAAAKLAPEIRDADFQEMLDLMSICRDVILNRNALRSDLGDRIEDLRRHNLRVAQYETLGSESDQVTTKDLQKLGADLEESIRRIIRSRIESEQGEVHKVK